MSGPGQYSIEPSNLFTYVDVDGTTKDIYATVEDAAEVNLSGSLAASVVHDQMIGFVGCTAPRQALIRTAATNAQALSRNGYSYLAGVTTGRARYTTWFGAFLNSRKNVVREHFRLISSRNFSGFTYDCSCTKAGVFAYVCAYMFQS